MTKLYIERARDCLHRKNFWANTQTTLTLMTLSERCKEIVGRDVSTSIIVRRALEVLAKQLKKATNTDLEMAALMRHVR